MYRWLPDPRQSPSERKSHFNRATNARLLHAITHPPPQTSDPICPCVVGQLFSLKTTAPKEFRPRLCCSARLYAMIGVLLNIFIYTPRSQVCARVLAGEQSAGRNRARPLASRRIVLLAAYKYLIIDTTRRDGDGTTRSSGFAISSLYKYRTTSWACSALCSIFSTESITGVGVCLCARLCVRHRLRPHRRCIHWQSMAK